MVSRLLIRGMLVGVVAGLLAFGFARLFAEPPVDSAIAFEARLHHQADGAPAATPADSGTPSSAGTGTMDMPAPGAGEAELVSRAVQAGAGLFTGVVLYSAAFGGLFALVFAFALGRIGRLGPRPLAVVLAGLGFVVLVLVPALKYPANPPSVGEADTIGLRTALFCVMLLVSLGAAALAFIVRERLTRSLGDWNAALAAAGVFVVVVAAAMLALPGVNEVPEHFPAAVLWRFRVASLGTQAVMWATIGLAFGALTDRSLTRPA